MNVTAARQTRFSGPARVELEQAMLRVVMALMVSLYAFWYVNVSHDGYLDEHSWIVLTTVTGWLILSIGIVATIWIWPLRT